MHSELEQLMSRISNLENDNAALHARVDAAETGSRRERRRLRIQTGLVFTGFLAAVLISPGNRAAIAQGYGVTLTSLNARLTAVEGKTQYISVDTTAQSTTFSGCNVIVNDGGGATSNIVTNSGGEGVGNLIIGYNSLTHFTGNGDLRTGSHNLVLGDGNNYSSYGGLVAGNVNAISSPYACVSGGLENVASGSASSVSGGQGNTASGSLSSISGGSDSRASGLYSSVSGGGANTASGDGASVSGGGANTASGYGASVSGGQFIVQDNQFGWAAGTYHSP